MIHRAFSHPTCYLAYFPTYYTMSAIAAIVWLRPDAQHILRFRRICLMRRYNSHSAAIIPHLQDKSRTGPLPHNQIRVNSRFHSVGEGVVSCIFRFKAIDKNPVFIRINDPVFPDTGSPVLKEFRIVIYSSAAGRDNFTSAVFLSI